MIKLPLNQVGAVNKISHASSVFEQEHERRPSLNEMADELNMPEDKIEDAFKATKRHVSVDAPINDDEGNSLLDVIASDEGAEADNELVAESLREEICRALSVLNDRERIIIKSFLASIKQNRPLKKSPQSVG